MRGRACCATVAVAAWVLSGCGNGAAQPVRMVSPEALAKASLGLYWESQLPLESGETVRRIDRLDENLYCLTSRNRLCVLHAATGLPRWYATLADPAQTVFAPVHLTDVPMSVEVPTVPEMMGDTKRTGPLTSFSLVAFNSLGELRVYDRTNGQLLRAIPFGFTANTSGGTDGDSFYVGSTDGWCHAIQISNAVRVWSVPMTDIVPTPPVVHGGQLFVAGGDGKLFSGLVKDRGERLWERTLDAPVGAAFHVDERGILVPSEDYRLYFFDVATGRKLWEPVACQGPLRSPVQAGTRTAFQYASGDGLYAVNLTNGEVRWRLPEGRTVLAVIGRDAYLLDSSRRLLVVDEVLGTVRTSVPLTGMDLFVPSTTAPAIFSASADGRVFCLRDPAAGRLTAEKLRGK